MLYENNPLIWIGYVWKSIFAGEVIKVWEKSCQILEDMFRCIFGIEGMI